MLTMARSVGSGIRNGISSSKDERDAMRSSSRLTLKMRGTSKESLSNSVDDKITEDTVYQRLVLFFVFFLLLKATAVELLPVERL